MEERNTKLYYAISEVAEIVGVSPSVLRYWEKEFRLVSPKRSGAQVRQYRARDISILKEIAELLYTKKFTLEGAKLELKKRKEPDSKEPSSEPESTVPAVSVTPNATPANDYDIQFHEQLIEENLRLKALVAEMKEMLHTLLASK